MPKSWEYLVKVLKVVCKWEAPWRLSPCEAWKMHLNLWTKPASKILTQRPCHSWLDWSLHGLAAFFQQVNNTSQAQAHRHACTCAHIDVQAHAQHTHVQAHTHTTHTHSLMVSSATWTRNYRMTVDRTWQRQLHYICTQPTSSKFPTAASLT